MARRGPISAGRVYEPRTVNLQSLDYSTLPRRPSSLVSRLPSTLRCGRRLRLLSLLSALFVADQTRHRGHSIGGLQPLEPHPLRGPSDEADFVHSHPRDSSFLRNHHDLVAGLYLHDPDRRAVSLAGPNVDDPFAAAPLQAILLQLGTLAVPPFGHGEDRRARRDHLSADHLVAVLQGDADDAARGATHRSGLIFSETNGHPLPGAEQNLVVPLGHADRNQLILFIQRDRDDASRARVAVGVQLGLLDDPALRCHQEVAIDLELADRDHG